MRKERNQIGRVVLSDRQYGLLRAVATGKTEPGFEYLGRLFGPTLRSALYRGWVGVAEDGRLVLTVEGAEVYRRVHEAAMPERARAGDLSPTVAALLSGRIRRAVHRAVVGIDEARRAS